MTAAVERLQSAKMAVRADDLIEKVMSLPEAQRDAFLWRLYDRLDAETGEANDVDWTPELERRAEDVLSGTSVTVDGEAFPEQIVASHARG